MITAVALKNIAKLVTRSVDVSPSISYRTIGVKWWGEGAYERETIDGLQTAAKTLSIVKENDLIINKIWVRHGSIAIAGKNVDGCAASGEFPTFEIDVNQVLPLWLHWYTKTKEFWDKCSELSQGTSGKNRIKPDLFLTVEIPLPPLEEQQRIVGRIEELAGKIAEARGLRERSIEECGLLLKSSVKAIIYNESTGQNLKPLKDLVTVKGGGTPSKQNPMFWKGSIPWISAKDIKKREVYNSIDHISEDALNNSSTKMIEAGAVVVVTRGMILAHTFPSTILRIPATINQDLKALIPGKGISSEYLSHVLWALNDSILELVEKSTHDTRKLETPKLLNFKIPVPQILEQQRIVTYLDELYSKVDMMKRLRQESLKELDALLPAILDKAFKGEL